MLEKTHKNKIDVIYIDPPYNTGNQDFAYNDKILNSDDEYKHSKWLSFMEKRLKIAKRLLKNNGVIFISIDKNEASQLKLLMDDIFGEDSFVADLHIETSVIGGPRRIPAMAGSVVKTTEFVYGYVNEWVTKTLQDRIDDVLGKNQEGAAGDKTEGETPADTPADSQEGTVTVTMPDGETVVVKY